MEINWYSIQYDTYNSTAKEVLDMKIYSKINWPVKDKAGESQPRAPGQNDDWWARAPCPSRLSRWLFLIAINERIASELLARNRRITDKNAMW
jgi:hypothetical protein